MMTPSPQPYLSIERVSKTFGGVDTIADFSLSLDKGAFLSLLGPSGCGKTTILRMIAGLETTDGGTIRLDGEPIEAIPANRRDIGFVFQSYALFPHLTVAENVAFGLRARRVTVDERAKRVDEALALVGLEALGHRRPAELSGGQRQRVAIARTVVVRPRLLLLDEPLSNLDPMLRTRVRAELRDLHDRVGLTTIMVTHDPFEALSISDSIAVLEGGRLLQHDTPRAIYERPAHRLIASLIGSPPATLLPFERIGAGVCRIGTALWEPQQVIWENLAGMGVSPCLAGVRPETVRLAPHGTAHSLPCRIVSAEYQGAGWVLTLDVGGASLTALHTGEVPTADAPAAVLIGETPSLFCATTGHRLG